MKIYIYIVYLLNLIKLKIIIYNYELFINKNNIKYIKYYIYIYIKILYSLTVKKYQKNSRNKKILKKEVHQQILLPIFHQKKSLIRKLNC